MTRLERAQRRYEAALTAYQKAAKGWKWKMRVHLEHRTAELLRIEQREKRKAAA